MLKNIDEASETLEVAKANLEKTTLVAAMESKVGMEITTIRSKIDINCSVLAQKGGIVGSS